MPFLPTLIAKNLSKLSVTTLKMGAADVAAEAVDTGLLRESEEPRVAVMLIILLASLFAVSFPTLSREIPFLRIPAIVFFIGKHFGTGVILATAFIHLLDDAFRSLDDVRVEERYGQIGRWTGAIILLSLLSIFFVEYVSTSYVEHLQENSSLPSTPLTSQPPSRPTTPPRQLLLPPSKTKTRPALSEITPLFSSLRARTLPARTSRPYSFPSHHSQHHAIPSALDLPGIPIEVLSGSPRICRLSLHSKFGSDLVLAGVEEVDEGQDEDEGHEHYEHRHENEHHHDDRLVIGRRRQVVGLLVLQLGIMIHSFVIGLTLTVTSGSDFTSLTTAIIFHQIFEGLSLGIRIAALPPAPRPKYPGRWSLSGVRWLTPTLSVLFGVTTPCGMALGMIVWKDYRGAGAGVGEEASMLLTQGIMSAVSAGMLIYAATVEMIAGDFVFGDVDGNHHHHHNHAEENTDGNADAHGSEGAHAHGNVESSAHGHEGTNAAEKQTKASVSKRVLAVLSLFAGSIMMVLIALGE